MKASERIEAEVRDLAAFTKRAVEEAWWAFTPEEYRRYVQRYEHISGKVMDLRVEALELGESIPQRTHDQLNYIETDSLLPHWNKFRPLMSPGFFGIMWHGHRSSVLYTPTRRPRVFTKWSLALIPFIITDMSHPFEPTVITEGGHTRAMTQAEYETVAPANVLIGRTLVDLSTSLSVKVIDVRPFELTLVDVSTVPKRRGGPYTSSFEDVSKMCVVAEWPVRCARFKDFLNFLQTS